MSLCVGEEKVELWFGILVERSNGIFFTNISFYGVVHVRNKWKKVLLSVDWIGLKCINLCLARKEALSTVNIPMSPVKTISFPAKLNNLPALILTTFLGSVIFDILYNF